ncbi:MAG TPA: glycosyltransferase [Clostridiales bacterium]|jgi:dolichol-phosphate mannosyltransferase|nr:glycosyltransferase [Clostridiales bacterium]
MKDLLDCVVLIPSLHPDELLPKYVEELNQAGFMRVLVVDDGSGEDEQYQSIFRELNEREGCRVIGYPENHGKGYALKHGINYIKSRWPDAPGIVTADSDGQHTAPDVEKVAKKMLEKPDALIIGSRDFKAAGVPAKSLIGNRLTSFFFLLLYGRRLPDTQTGLRGLPNKLWDMLLEISGERFEYELNVLINCANQKVPFETVPIQTIYLEDNRRSHFRAVQDSLLIYGQLFGNFFKYALSSILSFLIDWGVFTLFDKVLAVKLFGGLFTVTVGRKIAISTVIARIVSALFNFTVNKNVVFTNDAQKKGAGIRYIVVAAFVLLSSFGGTWLLHSLLKIDEVIIKPVVDTVLYFVTYRLQKSWVFPTH